MFVKKEQSASQFLKRGRNSAIQKMLAVYTYYVDIVSKKIFDRLFIIFQMDDKVIEALDPLAEVRNVLDDEESFENNVLAEEKRKSSALNQLKIARSQSIGSNQQSSLLHTVTDAASEEDDVGELSAEDQDENVQTAFFQSLAASYAISTDFQRVLISRTGDEVDSDTAAACTILHKCMKIREKWIGAHPEPPQDKEPPEPVLVGSPRYGGKGSSMYRRRADLKYDVFDEELPCSTAHEYEAHMSNGVMQIHRVSISGESTEESTTSLFPVYSFDEYVADFYTVKHGVFFGPTGSYCHHNLELLTAKFSLHRLLNANRESDAQKSVPHRDFYNIRKVDTHVHHSACMNQKHLLRFIKHKLKTVPNEVVIFRDGKFLTLGEVFKSLNLTAYDLSVDTLDMVSYTQKSFCLYLSLDVVEYMSYVLVISVACKQHFSSVRSIQFKIQSCWAVSIKRDLLEDR